jgi:hypothetical protein
MLTESGAEGRIGRLTHEKWALGRLIVKVGLMFIRVGIFAQGVFQASSRLSGVFLGRGKELVGISEGIAF